MSYIFVEAHHIRDVVVWIFNKESKDERRGEWVICGSVGTGGNRTAPIISHPIQFHFLIIQQSIHGLNS
jgi:hypothetical protein